MPFIVFNNCNLEKAFFNEDSYPGASFLYCYAKQISLSKNNFEQTKFEFTFLRFVDATESSFRDGSFEQCDVLNPVQMGQKGGTEKVGLTSEKSSVDRSPYQVANICIALAGHGLNGLKKAIAIGS